MTITLLHHLVSDPHVVGTSILERLERSLVRLGTQLRHIVEAVLHQTTHRMEGMTQDLRGLMEQVRGSMTTLEEALGRLAAQALVELAERSDEPDTLDRLIAQLRELHSPAAIATADQLARMAEMLQTARVLGTTFRLLAQDSGWIPSHGDTFPRILHDLAELTQTIARTLLGMVRELMETRTASTDSTAAMVVDHDDPTTEPQDVQPQAAQDSPSGSSPTAEETHPPGLLERFVDRMLDRIIGPEDKGHQSAHRTPETATTVASVEPLYTQASRRNHPNDTVIHLGNMAIGHAPVVIGGPSVAESRAQLLSCGRAVQAAGGHILRGDCFMSQGGKEPGSYGLNLLRTVGRELGLPVMTGVTQRDQLKVAARHVDLIQIPAEHMANRLLLEEAAALELPLVLTRDPDASVDAWLAAAEVVLAAGHPHLILLDQGVRLGRQERPSLDLTAIPLLRKRTHLPILIDPSRACDHPRQLGPLTMAALAVGAQGVRIAVHPTPETATLGFHPEHALTPDAWGRLVTTALAPDDDGHAEPFVRQAV